jgi:hypothetical protein
VFSIPYRCVFVKVPKTAGTSVAEALRCTHIGKPHRDIREIRDALCARPEGKAFYDNAFKFGFVRNPWDRVVSLHLRKEKGRLVAPTGFEDFCRWIEKASDTCLHPSPKTNQLDWLTDESGAIAVDFVGRFENLEADVATIRERVGAPPAPLPHKKRNAGPARKHYTEYYTPELRDMIGEKFAVDIEHFGYAFGEEDPTNR